MKRTPLKRVGKIGKRNLAANKKLKDIFEQAEITWCEIGMEGCLRTSFLQYAHRHKRVWYRSQPELLADLSQVVLACQSCHEKIESNKELTEEVFNKLRR